MITDPRALICERIRSVKRNEIERFGKKTYTHQQSPLYTSGLFGVKLEDSLWIDLSHDRHKHRNASRGLYLWNVRIIKDSRRDIFIRRRISS